MKVLLASPYGGVSGGMTRWTGHIINYYNVLGNPECELSLLPMGRSTFVNLNVGMITRLKYAIVDYRKILSDYRQVLKSDRYDQIGRAHV